MAVGPVALAMPHVASNRLNGATEAEADVHMSMCTHMPCKAVAQAVAPATERLAVASQTGRITAHSKVQGATLSGWTGLSRRNKPRLRRDANGVGEHAAGNARSRMQRRDKSYAANAFACVLRAAYRHITRPYQCAVSPAD